MSNLRFAVEIAARQLRQALTGTVTREGFEALAAYVAELETTVTLVADSLEEALLQPAVELAAHNIIWEGPVDGVLYRIDQVAVDDCVVEYKAPGGWEATDDEIASHIYVQALLSLRKLLP